MKEADLHTRLASDLGQGALRLVERPLARKYATVLIAVAVAYHHLLHGQFTVLEGFFIRAFALKIEAAYRHRMRKKTSHDAGPVFQIVKGLKERDNGQVAHKPMLSPSREASLTGEEIHSKQIGKAARHTHNQRADSINAMLGDVFSKHFITSKHLIRFATGRRSRAQKRTRGAQLLVQERQATLFTPLRKFMIRRAARLK